jgi:hypothetical protein
MIRTRNIVKMRLPWFINKEVVKILLFFKLISLTVESEARGRGTETEVAELTRARICKRVESPGIDSHEPIPPAYLAWRGRTTNRAVVPARHAGNRFLDSLKGLQIRAQTTAGGKQNAPFKRGQVIIFKDGNTPVRMS